MGKYLILLGAVLVIVGILWQLKITIPFLGKLPGDFVYKGDNVYFYFPLATCILLSVILSILFYFFGKS